VELWVGLGAMFVGVAVLLALAFDAGGESSVQRRMSIYTLTGRSRAPAERQRLSRARVAKSAVDFAGRVVARRDPQERLARALDAAGLPLKPPEWALLHAGIAVATGLLLLAVTEGSPLPTLAGIVIGAVVPWAFLVIRQSRRRTAFYEQLPDTLQLVAGSLSAGYSMPQAVDTVVREGNQPIAGELYRALAETRLGVPLEDALDTVADRMRSRDFHWVVMAVRIQRDVGGNLAEVLGTVAATLRERERLRRQVRVLSAEGRLSALVISLLPVVFIVVAVIARPTYLKPLYTTAFGGLMLITASVLFVAGIFWLRRVTRVEV
jgi:tight adherence protein B